MTALERTVALHLLRTGQFEVAETFLRVGPWSRHIYSYADCIQESKIKISNDLRDQFVDLHQILKSLRNEDITPALR